MHSTNGNHKILSKQLAILQVSCSNSNFETKLEELSITLEKNKADLVITSESNMDVANVEKVTQRASKNPQYTFVDKVIPTHPKAQLTLMIHNDAKYKRMDQ